MLEAAKSKDLKKCELIDASALRARCRAVTAMVAGDADGCPLKAPSKPDLGRDATCVAVALRSPAMCAGAQRRDRPSCEALVSRDTKKCDAIPVDDLRAGCTRDATRFRGVLVGNAAIASVPPAKGTLTFTERANRPATTPISISTSARASSSCSTARRRASRSDASARSPRRHAPRSRSIARASRSPFRRPTEIEITEAALTVPGAPVASCTACTLSLKVDKLEPKRAGIVSLVVDGSLGTWKIHADVQTFVRDVTTR